MFKKCCFFISLDKGTIFVGVASIILHITVITLAIVMLCGVGDIIGSFDYEIVTVQTWLISLIILDVVNIITDILLIIGVVKKSANYFLPWLILNGMAIVLTLAVLLLGIYRRKIIWGVSNLFLLIVQLYFYCVVYSCMRSVDNDDDDN